MKGYKGMEYDMTCRGFQYEIGKEYHTDEDVKLCENGFHFCKNLKDVFYFYKKNENNRFFEVEAHIVESDDVKSVADKICIVRELTTEEINRYYYSSIIGNNYYCKNGGIAYNNGYGDGDNSNGCGDGDGYGCYDDGDGHHYYGDMNGNGSGYGNYGNKYGDGIGYVFGNIYNIENTLKFI